MEDEVAEKVGEPYWYITYSHMLQQVGEAVTGRKWAWPAKEGLEVKISPLVLAFWGETGMDLTLASLKLCWELTPHTIYCKVEEGMISHMISFLDELAIRVPSHRAWDQFMWPPLVATLWALQEPELYGYCHGQVVDMGPVLAVAQFWVTDKVGNYLCMARALVFEGSILAYNPTHNEAEWIPARAWLMTWHLARKSQPLPSPIMCCRSPGRWSISPG